MAIKTIKIKRPAGATGGAAIADRLKLNAPEAAPVAPNGKATTYAVVAAVLAFLAAGVLTYILWKHWEFLMPA